MTSEELLYFGVGSFLIGLSLFCANLLILRQRHRHIHLPLALFFLAEAASSAPLLFDAIAKVYDADDLLRVLTPLNLPFSMMLAPLFWLYVRGLTTEGSYADLRYKVLHAVPALFGACVMVLFLVLPADIHHSLEQGDAVDYALVPILIAGIWTLTIMFYAQVAFYLFLTVRLLIAYNTRLKDMFASTENRELYWIWWIMLVSACFLIFNIANVVMILFGLQLLPKSVLEQPFIDLSISAAIIWVLALWGLRQKPGLLRDTVRDNRDERQVASPAQKYERSALSEEQAQRLARKIKSAMQNDLLYRDPNLSLWDLSKHIGVTSNYLSQTLNETIGSNFFDYVNRWRIDDAVKRVRDTDETILAIAYDVGFNSKSSFYKAFKAHVGTTPLALRKARTSDSAVIQIAI